MDGLNVWMPLLGEYGFPVMVTIYLLYRLEQKIDNVTTAIDRLPEKLSSNQDVTIRSIK
ncbi:YvrJ family protein [Bacillus suaedae]|uniref:YvrJ family protein n=1 Tax=Halalkalibacter suaedae TaxID=2822140 RepID=A0A940WT00_9BACI|nr:YvrJ family protein [Bacillus suaedae]MBP3951218.1 YvrJ family protein [Bacillus suaedae]